VSLDPLTYRRAVGRFVTGVTVVTTRELGVDSAMTANSFTSVSLSPLLVLVSVDKTARFHDAVAASGLVGISVLSADQEDLARWFATRGRPVDARAAGFPHHDGEVTGAVLFDGSLLTLEGRVRSTHDAGDHTLVVAEVVSLATPRADGVPLVYYAGGYRSLT
jgi:flavin reductase (DIM6/NTAB) family NADH-FMN oxidoreductase RutF